MNLLGLDHIRIILQLSVGALGLNSTVLHYDYVVRHLHDLDGMGCQDARLVLHQSEKDLLADIFADLYIQGGDRVVHDKDVWSLVDRSGQGEPGFLPAGQVDTFLANLCHVSCRHDLEIWLQLAGKDRLYISPFVKVAAKQHVVAQLAVLDPRLLLVKSSRSVDGDGASAGEVRVQQGVLEGPHLQVLNRSAIIANKLHLLLGDVDHLTNHSVKQAGLARSHLADNYCERALLDLNVQVLETRYLIHSAVVQRYMDVSMHVLLVTEIVPAFADAAHVLGLLIVVLLPQLLPDLVLISAVKLRSDSPAEVSHHLDCILTPLFSLYSLYQACLTFGRTVKLPQLFHTLPSFKEVPIQMEGVL